MLWVLSGTLDNEQFSIFSTSFHSVNTRPYRIDPEKKNPDFEQVRVHVYYMIYIGGQIKGLKFREM